MQWQTLGARLPRSGNRFTRTLGRAMMRLSGWQLEGEIPDHPKMIVAVAPHTSNIDFLLTVMVLWGLGLEAAYLAKQSLFRFPLGIVMRYFGGIPVDRGAANGMVEQLAREFKTRPQLVLGITPEGTRSKVKQWKRGFALIAAAASVPVLPAIINYETRVVRFHPLITDVADPDKTLTMVQCAAASGAARHR